MYLEPFIVIISFTVNTINADSNETTLIDVNHKPVYSVKIYNLEGINMEPLAGAELELRDSNGELVEKIVSTEDGVVVTGLTKGTYTLSQTKAPKGYALSTTSETFEITNNEVLTINYINSEVYVPITGSSSKLLVIGIIAIIAGASFVFFANTSKKRYN